MMVQMIPDDYTTIQWTDTLWTLNPLMFIRYDIRMIRGKW
jgi:hypothetical protein